MVGHDARDRILGVDMLMLKVTEVATGREVAFTHEIKNRGKANEEHTIRVHELKGAVMGNGYTSWVLTAEQAKELKSHL
jgi:hypothetical protein